MDDALSKSNAGQTLRAASDVRRAFLIVRNRNAGLKTTRLVAQVASALAANGARADIVETAVAGDVQHALADAGRIDAVVAAGGDGTVRALALTLADLGLGLPVGLIPAGTGNVLANELGLPGRADRLADVLMHGPARAVHVMQANGTPFLLMASSGFDAAVLLRLSVALKQKIARAAYAQPTLAAMAHETITPFEVVVDGKPHTATWAIVASARTYGGSFRLVRDVSIFDESLRAVLFSARTRAGRLRELMWLAAGQAERCKGVSVIACREVLIRAPRQQPCQIDGDPLGFGPVEVAPAGRTLSLIVPFDAR